MRPAPNQAIAINTMIRSSPRKLNLVAAEIRGMPAHKALGLLDMNKKLVSDEVKKVLLAAIANAENNHNLDIDALRIVEASVGKSIVMKRYMPRARGRASAIRKPFSRLRIVVEQVEEVA